MAKLEEDYTYIELQRQLKECRNVEQKLTEYKKILMHDINAIKREYLKYELATKNDV